MTEGRAKFATIQRSEDGLSVGVRLRVALDVLETLGEAGVALAPRSPKSRLKLDRVELDEEGLSHVEGTGDTTGAAQLVWEIIAGKTATWSGTATDDDLPDDVPGAVLDVLAGLMGEKGAAGDLGEKLEEASRGFVDTHDDVRSAVSSWRDAHADEEPAPAPPPPAPPPPKVPDPIAKAAAPAQVASPAAPKPSGADPTATSKPDQPSGGGKEPEKVSDLTIGTSKPALPAEKAAPAPPAKPIPKPVAARLPSELPDAWDAPAPLSEKLDQVIDAGELPPPESLAPPMHAEGPAVAVPYPPVPAAPRSPSFVEEEEKAEIKKPGRVAPPDPSAPPPPPTPLPAAPAPIAAPKTAPATASPGFPAPTRRAPQATVPETKSARTFLDTVPPGGDATTTPIAVGSKAPPVPRGAPPRAPLKTDPLGTPQRKTLSDTKKTEPMRPRPPGPPTNGALAKPAVVDEEEAAPVSIDANDLVDNGAADPKARSVDVVEPPASITRASDPGTAPSAVPKPPAAPRKTVPDLKKTEPFRRRLPGPEDPGGDEAPARGPLSRPLPPDAAALATDGAIPLPVQPAVAPQPAAKVILDGNPMRAAMQTVYTRKDGQVTPPPVVEAAPPAPLAPDFSIPAPPKKGKGAFIAVAIVAVVGIGVFAALASQIQGPPEVLPTPTVTAPPTDAPGATAPPPPTAAPTPAPTPQPTAAAPSAPSAPSAMETSEPAPTATAASRGNHPGPKGTGSRNPKKWQPALPDRL